MKRHGTYTGPFAYAQAVRYNQSNVAAATNASKFRVVILNEVKDLVVDAHGC